jgi:hypothetical protein
MASRPLWIFWTDDSWVISSHANAIAFSFPSVDMDLGALGAFLLYGGPVEPRKSLFKGIRAMPPGCLVRLDSAGQTEKTRWYRFRHEPDLSLSRSAWVELAAERLVRAAARIVKQCARPAVFFSGGVDSRLTAVALKAAGAKPLLITLGDARNLEVRVSAHAAKVMGLEHVVLLRDRHWYLRALKRVVSEIGGIFLWTHGHFSQAVGKLRAEYDVDGMFLGDFCEAFSKLFCSVAKRQRLPWTPEQFAREFDHIRLPLYRPTHRDESLALLNSIVRGEVEVALRQDILERYRRGYDAATDPWIIGDQFLRWESAATLPTFSMFLDLRSVSAERNLMFDRDVHELLEALPSPLRNGANLGALIIRKLDPSVSLVPNSNSLVPMAWPPILHRLSKRCKPVLGAMRRRIVGDSHTTTGSWSEKSALYATDPTWRHCFEEVLGGEELFALELFDRQRVRRSWSTLAGGHRAAASDIEKMVQLAILAKLKAAGSTTVPAGHPR